MVLGSKVELLFPTWICFCLGGVFTDSTVVNHHEKSPFGRIWIIFFQASSKQIQKKTLKGAGV